MFGIKLFGRSKPQTTGGGESAEGESSAVATEQKAKTSSDFFREYPLAFDSQLKFVDKDTRSKVDSIVESFEGSTLLMVNHVVRTNIEQQKSRDGDPEAQKILERILGMKIKQDVVGSVDLPKEKVDRTKLPSANSQIMDFHVYQTNYDDIFLVETSNTIVEVKEVKPAENQPHFIEDKTFVVKMAPEDVENFRKTEGNSREVQLSRIDSDFATQFSQGKTIT